ncbi:unnamed protein product [Calypogeia fissa]
MAQNSISAISPSPPYGGCPLLPAPAHGAAPRGISGLELFCSSSNSNWSVSVEKKLNSGSWGKLGRRLGRQKARVIGTGGNYSFHKGSLQPVQCHKMFVPGFGEKSPEAKAADSLHNFFTFVAVKIVLSQLQDYNREGYQDLMDFVDRVSLKDGDKFCATLMRESFRHKGLAMRIMEVRSAYAKQDFEWDNLQNLCNKNMDEANTRLMREFLVDTSEYEN